MGISLWLTGLTALAAGDDGAPVGQPGELELADALEMAAQNSPALRSAQWQIQAREAEGLQARKRANPELEVGVEHVAGSGEFSGTDAAEYTVMISQPLSTGGKRSKQQSLSDTERRIAEWSLDSAAQDLVRDVKVAFADMLGSQEHIAIAEELVELSQELVETANRRVKSGGASILEETKAEIERATSLAHQAQQEQVLAAARRKLGTLLGIPGDTVSSVTGNLYARQDLPAFEDLKHRLPNNPDWGRGTAEIAQHQAAAALADARRTPNVNLGLGWKRDEASASDAFIFAVGLPLPIFDRNRDSRDAARHALAATREAVRAVEQELARELSDAYSEAKQAQVKAAMMEEKILPAAEQAFTVSKEGYLGGRFGYLDLLDAQRTLFDTRSAYIETLQQYHQAAAEIERLTANKL